MAWRNREEVGKGGGEKGREGKEREERGRKGLPPNVIVPSAILEVRSAK